MGVGESKLDKHLEEEFPLSERYYGFHNFGNTCYCNSVLQALYFCQPFRMAILNWSSQRAAQLQIQQEKDKGERFGGSLINLATSVAAAGTKDSEPPLLTALSMLFDEIQSQKRKTGTIRPSNFVSTLRKENVMFNSPSQQDAHEFLMFLLNDVSDALEKQAKSMVKKLEVLNSHVVTNGRHAGSIPSQGSYDSSSDEGDEEHREDIVATAVMGGGLGGGEGSGNTIKTFVQSIFHGTLTNETKCLTCETITSRDEHFLDVQVDIEQNCSLTHCLSRFSKIERLSGTNKFSCETCGALQEAEKRTRFKSLPKILVLHLKRFKYLETPGIHAKLSHRVTFPVELRIPSLIPSLERPDLSPLPSLARSSIPDEAILPPPQSSTSHLPNSSHHSSANHLPNTAHNQSSLSSSSTSSSSFGIDDDPLYYLSAMVAHLGSTAHSGHYVCFIRSGDKWLSMDDNHVIPVHDTELLMNRAFGCWNHNPEDPQHSASAYILFYERRQEVGRV